MHKILRSIIPASALIGFLAIAQPVCAEVTEIAIPDSDERLLVAIPDDWHLAYETGSIQAPTGFYLREYIPKGQTVKNWDEMITIQVMRLDKPISDPMLKEFAIRIGSAFKANCLPDDKQIEKDNFTIIEATRNGYTAVIYLIECYMKPEVVSATSKVHTRPYEVLSGALISSANYIYNVQRATHTDRLGHSAPDDMRSFAEGSMADYNESMRFFEARTASKEFSLRGMTPCRIGSTQHPCNPPPITVKK